MLQEYKFYSEQKVYSYKLSIKCLMFSRPILISRPALRGDLWIRSRSPNRATRVRSPSHVYFIIGPQMRIYADINARVSNAPRVGGGEGERHTVEQASITTVPTWPFCLQCIASPCRAGSFDIREISTSSGRRHLIRKKGSLSKNFTWLICEWSILNNLFFPFKNSIFTKSLQNSIKQILIRTY